MTNPEIIQSVEADKPRVATNPIILIMGVVIFLLILIIAILIWYVLGLSVTKKEDIVPTVSSTPEVTTTITSLVTPVVSQVLDTTVSPTTVVEEQGNFSRQPNWNAFISSTADIYGTKPDKPLISEFKFRYPSNVTIATSYRRDGNGLLVEINGKSPMTTYLFAQNLNFSTAEQIKEELYYAMYLNECFEEINMSDWQNKIVFSYVKLGSYTWTKASFNITSTCPNDKHVSANVEALGILSRKGQMITVANMSYPLDNEVLEILKTFEFIY